MGVTFASFDAFLIERVCPPQPHYREDRPDYFAFCKTEHKPYDLVVCGVLAALCQRCPEFDIQSDGTRPNGGSR